MENDNDYGPNWIRSAFHVSDMSEIGEDAARLLNDLYLGIYHIDRECRRVDWSNKYYIEITVRNCWSTYDFDNLTRLVFLAHDYALRVELIPRGFGYTRILFHRRQREGNLYQRHPTIEDALANWRKNHAGQDVK